MKKLVLISLLSVPALCVANQLTDQITRATNRAFANNTVKVEVKLAKPVRMSDVMVRPVRGGHDMVIRVDYKAKACIGRLSEHGKEVVVPAQCVASEGAFFLSKMRLTFADGRQVVKQKKALQTQGPIARIRL